MIQQAEEALRSILNMEKTFEILRVVAFAVLALLILRIIVFFVAKSARKRFSPQSAMIIKKTLFLGGLFFIFLYVLRGIGVKLAGIIGAAGVAGIAVGFAPQTSLSNVISGLFLIGEKPFAVGDLVRIDSTTGVVLSIDLLSVKIRTFDNLYIRIPNESLIKAQVTNITRFPIRRLDIVVSVAYKEDLERAREVLLDVAGSNPFCLDNPPPFFVIREFGESGIDLQLGAWFEKSDYINLKNSLIIDIHRRFDQEGIEIPFPHLSLYAGQETGSFPVRIIQGEER